MSRGTAGAAYIRPTAAAWSLHPDGFVVKGVNIVPHPSDSGLWRVMWEEWDWNNWIRPQIDKCVRLGANTIRFFGTHRGLLSGSVTASQMEARWRQWAEYCIAQGLALYPCLGDDFWDDLPGTTAEMIAGTSAQQATILNDYAARCIGMDNVQENVSLWMDGTKKVVISNAVKAVTSIPLAYSMSAGVTWSASTSAGQDFVDFHTYGRSVARANLDAFWAANPSAKILCGEFGVASNETQAEQESIYGHMLDLVANYRGPGGQRLAGACAWAITEQQSIGWGMWPADFSEAGEKTAMTNGHRRLPNVRW